MLRWYYKSSLSTNMTRVTTKHSMNVYTVSVSKFELIHVSIIRHTNTVKNTTKICNTCSIKLLHLNSSSITN